MTVIKTRVGIIGAGPAGLFLSHLLARQGIESVVIDSRSREDIERTVRAGILEAGTVKVLHETGASQRVLRDASEHRGMQFWFDGAAHRFDFEELTGRVVWLYPQQEVLIDLIATRLSEGQDIRFGVTAERVENPESDHPSILARGEDGARLEIRADFVVGADGSRSVARSAVTGAQRNGFFREYPYAWFGVLAEARPSVKEPVYSHSPDGFALISHRSESIQRLYFQCDPATDPSQYTEDEIWDELQKRTPGTQLIRGPIFQRDVLRFRSFVASSLRRGRVAIIGDAAHTVPPTGAKGLNLAISDALILGQALTAALREKDDRLLEGFPELALHRIWKAQHFSWWMTNMLHHNPDATDFDRNRQLGELRMVTGSEEGRRYLAEAYTGWPLDVLPQREARISRAAAMAA